MQDLRVRFPTPCDEKWEAMTPAGCDRVCARCDRVIHDLSQYAFDEAEALLRANPGSCVRASIDADGVVALKPGRGGSMRRMVIAAGATAGLLAASQPALAGQKHPYGAITGTVASYEFRTFVTATAADGKRYRKRVKGGRYAFDRLPAGTYTLTFTPDCGDSWTVGNLVVVEGQSIVADTRFEHQCIVVGKLEVEEHRA